MTDRPDDEALLGRFADWLREARAESNGLASSDLDQPADSADVGLGRLVEEFTALKHELKLQTKSSRGLQDQTEALLPELRRAIEQFRVDQTEALLPELRRAIEQFRGVEPKESQAAWSAGKPLAEALADLDEALERGRLEIVRAQERIIADAERTAEQALASLRASQRWPWRPLLRSYHERVAAIVREEVLAPRRAVFEALVEGYGLIQARLRRALKAEQIARIDCVGRTADPSLMTVIEVVDAPATVPPGHVVEEVRPGYTWQGRVLRFAEVRAARRPPAPANEVQVQVQAPAVEPETPARHDAMSGQSAHHD